MRRGGQKVAKSQRKSMWSVGVRVRLSEKEKTHCMFTKLTDCF